MPKEVTVVFLPQDADRKPIWDEAKAIAIPNGADIFSLISDIDEMTKHCVLVFNEKVYVRSGVKSTLDLSGDDVSYAIYVVEMPDPDADPGVEVMDVDATGKPKFRLIAGGKK